MKIWMTRRSEEELPRMTRIHTDQKAKERKRPGEGAGLRCLLAPLSLSLSFLSVFIRVIRG
jgi:hypothetical protein